MAGGAIGYATLPIIPSFRGIGSGLAKQITAPVRAAGVSAGVAGGTAAGGGFRTGMGRAVKGLGKTVAIGVGGGLAVGTAALGVVAGTALSKGLDRAISIQNAQAKLTGLGHSTQTVTKIMDNALASVKGTAFGLGDAAGVAAGAVAAGIAPGQQLQRTLSLVADSATIAGTDMGSMGSIFNKVAASGKLQGDVIAQLQDAGVPVLQFVAKEIGKTAAETADLASKGKIDFATFSNAMEHGLGGAALASGSTAQGAFANVQAALGRLGAGLLAGPVKTAPVLFTSVSGAIDRLGVSLQPVIAKFSTFSSGVMVDLAKRIDGINFDQVIARVTGFASTVRTKFLQVKTAISTALASSGGGGNDFGKIFGSLGQIGNVIAPLMPIFVALGQAIGGISGSIGQLIGSGVQLLPPIITVLSTALQFLADHSELVAPLILAIAAGMVVFRSAQAAANVAELGALPIKAANTAALFAQAGANRALATQMAIANGQQVASRLAMLPATAQVILQTGAFIGQRIAMAAGAVVTGVATAAQWAWNAALTANPIGIVIVAIAALVAGLVWFFTKTKLGQQLWSGFMTWLSNAWSVLKATGVAIFTALGSFFVASWNAIKAAGSAIWGAITGVIRVQIIAARTVVLAVVNALRAGWSAGLNAIAAVGRAIWAGIRAVVTSNINAVRAVVLAVVSAVRSAWSAGWSAVSSAVAGAAGAVRSTVSGMSSAVRSAIDGVVGFFRGIKGSITGALSGAGSWLTSVGRNIIQGLIGGLKAMGGSILSAVTGPIKSAISGAKSLLGIHSPSRVFRQIGVYVGKGLESGLKGSSKGVVTATRSITNAIINEYGAQQKNIAKARAAIAKATSPTNALRKTAAGRRQIARTVAAANRTIAAQPLTKRRADSALATVNAGNAKLKALATQRAALADKLKAANKKVTDQQTAKTKYRDSVVEGLATVDVTASQTGAGIITALKTRLADTKKFSSVMTQLRKSGLDATTYKQFISAGVDALPLAQNLLAGGKGQIKQVASLQGQLASASTSFANRAAGDLYDAGINAAKGLVKGLQSQQNAIAKQMTNISNSMVAAVKKALGIHSPSRVLYGLGMNTGQGYLNALSAVARPIRDAMTRAINPAGIRTPDLELDIPSESRYAGTAAALAAARASVPVEATATASTGRRGPLVEFSGNVGFSPADILQEAEDRARQAAQMAGIDSTEVLA